MVPIEISHLELGSLQGCLVGGDPQQRDQERRGRRRALLISIATQSVVVAAIVLIPLFSKPLRIAASVVPLPPYYPHSAPRGAERPHSQAPHPRTTDSRFFLRRIPDSVATSSREVDPVPDPIPGSFDGPPGLSQPGQIPIGDPRTLPRPPAPQVETPKTIRVTHLDPAMLTRRVEPVYPTLMRQIGRSGQVQLRAIIGTDGTVQSLQVVSGDPGFYQSALEAVGQWRYRPTILNGIAVEVDTFITVIYNVAR